MQQFTIFFTYAVHSWRTGGEHSAPLTLVSLLKVRKKIGKDFFFLFLNVARARPKALRSYYTG